MINVTKTFLPPIVEYTHWVQKAFDKFWLTNRGELVLLLEQKLKEYLGTDWITITNNGTVPLQIAVKLLGKGGEIITTPFSFVATTSSIVWENCTPVFVDIHPEFLTIDETKIEAAITDKTTCILATHVFGNPCDVDAIEKIAKKHNLKVIYDAAHCFGVNYNNKSVFNYGDISTCSFHATKIFHTGEGGALFSNDEELRLPLYYSHNFGQITPVEFYAEGINAKISELQAAMGLSVLPYMNEIISERKKVVEKYDQLLDFSKLQRLKIRQGTDWNYSYYPVLFSSENLLLKKVAEMNKIEIFPRRYFYPSLNTIPFANGKEMPVSEDISKRVLSLPLYVGLEENEIKIICDTINS
ncbi:MAG: DegT/DnrJ/EryC1/StrS family aminotransferase [Weeksellaceae bacterium]